MNLVVAMACIGMRILPEEAVNAATINGAFAMDLAGEMGSVSIGKKAILKIGNTGEYPIDSLLLRGTAVAPAERRDRCIEVLPILVSHINILHEWIAR